MQDFDQISSMIDTNDTEKKAIIEKQSQSMLMKNQNLEEKLSVMNSVKKEMVELKSQRDKQQTDIKTIYEEKQKLYEEIMSLKE